MKKIFSILIVVVLLSIVGYMAYAILQGPTLFKDHERRTVKINKTTYKLYVSDNVEKRMQGLSNVRKMPKNQGMLFIFEELDTYGFWMKDMKFPLDMIFLRENQAVDLKENILEASFPQIYYPTGVVDAVIELNAGEIQKSGIHIGDPVKVTK